MWVGHSQAIKTQTPVERLRASGQENRCRTAASGQDRGAAPEDPQQVWLPGTLQQGQEGSQPHLADELSQWMTVEQRLGSLQRHRP